MTYELLHFVHLAGMGLIAGGLIGVFVGDVRARQVRDVVRFAEVVRAMAVFYDGVVVPGALLLAASGARTTGRHWASRSPWRSRSRDCCAT